MSEKRKIKKGKLAAVAVAIIAIIAIIVIVLVVRNNDGEIGKIKKPGQDTQDKSVVYDLPETTYSDMQVTDIELEYLTDNDETMVTMVINNTTETPITEERITAYLIDKSDNTIGQTSTWIDSLNPGEQYSISVVLQGDLTATTQIKLQK